MSELLLSLQQQFGSNTAEITNHLIQMKSDSNSVQNKTNIVQIDRLLEETNELLEQIDLEIRGSNESQRSQHFVHLEAFRKEYEKLKTDFKNMKKQHYSDEDMVRIDLMGGDYDLESDDQKTRLLSEDTQRLEASERRLTDGYRLCLESEQIGSQILDNLSQQRETIQKSRDRLRGTNNELKRGYKLLNLMTRRSFQTRVLIYFIFILISIFFLYLIFDSMVY